MRKMILALAISLAALPVLAEDATPPAAPGRYTFNRVNDGFLRLDNQSGQVAFCSSHDVGWACQAVPEDRAALEKEIARLQDEVAGLKTEIATLREPPPPRPPAELSKPELAPSADARDDAAKMREDLERARAAIENAWRRLVDMIVNFQKDMIRKG
jgi:cell division protein FtsB